MFCALTWRSWWVLLGAAPFVALGIAEQWIDVPAWFWAVGAGIAFFYAFFLAFHKLRLNLVELEERSEARASRIELREQLASFLEMGDQVLFMMEFEPIAIGMSKTRPLDELWKDYQEKPKYRDLFDSWTKGARAFLANNLGREYVVRFNQKIVGLELGELSKYAPKDRPWAEMVLHHKARLEQFLDEI